MHTLIGVIEAADYIILGVIVCIVLLVWYCTRSTEPPAYVIKDCEYYDPRNHNQRIFNSMPEDIVLVDSFEKYNDAISSINLYCWSPYSILGFDCEWVNNEPVSLIQLATSEGFCAIFRIGQLGYIPRELQEILANKSILKVGVAALEDGQRLWKDYNIQVSGTLDLRCLANHFEYPSPKSLSDLSLHYLGKGLDKNIEIRCGNWNAPVLTEEQIEYAALDALVSALIYKKIKQRRGKSASWKDSHQELVDTSFDVYR